MFPFHLFAVEKIWKIIGNTGFTGVREEDSPSVPQLTLDSKSNLYVRFFTEDYKNIKIMRYDETSKEWLLFLEQKYDEGKSNVNISFDRKGRLFASFFSSENEQPKTTIMKYVTSSASWDMVGEEISESCGAPMFDNDNNLFISCSNKGIMRLHDTGNTSDTGNTTTDADTGDTADSANTSVDIDTTDSGDSVADTSDNENSSDSDGGNACAAVVI